MKLWQYQSKVEPRITSFGERITPDKWQPASNVPQSNWQKAALYSVAAIMPFTAFVNLGQPERTQVDKWYRQASEPIRTVQRVADFGNLTFLKVEVINADKWYRPASEPVFDIKRTQYLFLV